MSIVLVMPSNHLILCHPLLLRPSIYASVRVFSSESVLRIRWPKYWSFSFSISPSNEYSGLISTMVEAMKIMETSFNRSHECTVTLNAPNPAAGHLQPTPLLETPEHSWKSLGQSLVGSLILSCKSRKLRNTWSNRQIWPWSAEWSRTKANRVLQRELTGHSKHPLSITWEDYTWTPPNGQYWNQIDYILCGQR